MYIHIILDYWVVEWTPVNLCSLFHTSMYFPKYDINIIMRKPNNKPKFWYKNIWSVVSVLFFLDVTACAFISGIYKIHWNNKMKKKKQKDTKPQK